MNAQLCETTNPKTWDTDNATVSCTCCMKLYLRIAGTDECNALHSETKSANRAFHLITVCRHLHRPTLRELAAMLAPGGVLLFHTFLEGNSHPTDPASVLQVGELCAIFEGELQILRDDACAIDDGRILSFFVAQRPIH